MEQTFLTAIDIKKVRHLENIHIPLSNRERKHLILTGKNGSGKTSVLESLASWFSSATADIPPEAIPELDFAEEQRWEKLEHQYTYQDKYFKEHYPSAQNIAPNFSVALPYLMLDDHVVRWFFTRFIIAYYEADRISKYEMSSSVEYIKPKDQYQLSDKPGTKFIKYMVGLRATQGLAALQPNAQNQKRSAEIDAWFDRLTNILREIFEDPKLEIKIDIETFHVSILQSGREPFDFNTMASGYSAIFAIITDLLMRTAKRGDLEVEGVVLIDEIETHLHLELQKKILPFLTGMFPNIQFIVTTHSPFILNSIDNAVIFDLETKQLVSDGLANYPYEGIVEGYFKADKLSAELRQKFERYKALTSKEELSDEDYSEIDDLEMELDKIPDFLALDFATEYNKRKLEFSNRG